MMSSHLFPAMSDPVLLLTASVDPRGCSFTQRSDPAQRLEDYRLALSRWLADRCFRRVVLCENSSWNLDDFAEQRQQAKQLGIDLELLGFAGQDYPRDLGKGYGEMGIIAHALDHSRLLSDAATIIKVTGRYHVSNIAPLLTMVQQAPADVVCDLRNALTEADCRIFAASRAFLAEDLLPLRPLANDSQGVYLEHLLARAAHLAMGRGRRWMLMPMTPDVNGIGGSFDRRHAASMSKRLRHRIKQALIAY